MKNVDQRRSSDPRDANDDAWISADEAATLLGVKKTTLYAYASRELVRTAPGARARERLYRREDLERLRARSDARAGHAAVAAGALRWGEPVLDTAISDIDAAHGPRYRGKLAVELAAAGVPFEDVAEWLWTGVESSGARFVAAGTGSARLGYDAQRAARLMEDGARPLDALLVAGALLATRVPPPPGEEIELVEARVLVRRLCASLALCAGAGARERIDAALDEPTIAGAWLVALGGKSTPRARAAVDRALVVMAEHELNASTFAARIAAGTRAQTSACVLAALATLSGPTHGGSCDRIEALLEETRDPADATRLVRERLRRGDALPGFGHPLYAAGDPRTPVLIEAAEGLAPRAIALRKIRALEGAIGLAGGEAPTCDVGLVAIAAALGLPSGSAVSLMAMGRIAGWIAHAREQRAQGFQLRPRARYTGAS